MKLLITLLALALIAGCTSHPVKIVPIDGSLIDKETATAIFYTRTADIYEIHIDGVTYGTLNRHKPMYLELAPGKHKVYGKNAVTMDRQTDIELAAGQVYFLDVYWHQTGLPGLVASRVMITPARESYPAYECFPDEVKSISCP